MPNKIDFFAMWKRNILDNRMYRKSQRDCQLLSAMHYWFQLHWNRIEVWYYFFILAGIDGDREKKRIQNANTQSYSLSLSFIYLYLYIFSTVSLKYSLFDWDSCGCVCVYLYVSHEINSQQIMSSKNREAWKKDLHDTFMYIMCRKTIYTQREREIQCEKEMWELQKVALS